jgi:hypothetical protein
VREQDYRGIKRRINAREEGKVIWGGGADG